MTKGRKIISSWDLANDPEIDVFSDINGTLADTLQEIIDDEILSTMLQTNGWIKVDSYVLVPQEWLDANIKNKYNKLLCGWHFACAQDAEWFMLRWL